MNELLNKIADRMRRCDPEYCESHSVEQTTDDEWDELLAELEAALDALNKVISDGKFVLSWSPGKTRLALSPQSDGDERGA